MRNNAVGLMVLIGLLVAGNGRCDDETPSIKVVEDIVIVSSVAAAGELGR